VPPSSRKSSRGKRFAREFREYVLEGVSAFRPIFDRVKDVYLGEIAFRTGLSNSSSRRGTIASVSKDLPGRAVSFLGSERCAEKVDVTLNTRRFSCGAPRALKRAKKSTSLCTPVAERTGQSRREGRRTSGLLQCDAGGHSFEVKVGELGRGRANCRKCRGEHRGETN
jgi:hypothetical protein